MVQATSQIRLSPTQRQVVDFGDGSLLVVAGPGTGKTRVLTERVRRLLTIQREHFRVLALTFTNKAAREMEERLDDLGELGGRTFIGTLHGFCLNMLSDRGKPVGVNSTPQIFELFSDRRQVDGIKEVKRDTAFDDELFRSGGIRLYYDDVMPPIEGLKAGILLEAGFDNVTPNEPRTITSWAYEFAKDKVAIIDNRAIDVPCYDPG